MENDVRVDTVVAEIESRMLEEADAQLLERKRYACPDAMFIMSSPNYIEL